MKLSQFKRVRTRYTTTTPAQLYFNTGIGGLDTQVLINLGLSRFQFQKLEKKFQEAKVKHSSFNCEIKKGVYNIL